MLQIMNEACYCSAVTSVKDYFTKKTIAHKWNTGFSQLDHRIYPVIGQNTSVNGILSSLANQINLVNPAVSIRRYRLFNDLKN